MSSVYEDSGFGKPIYPGDPDYSPIGSHVGRPPGGRPGPTFGSDGFLVGGSRDGSSADNFLGLKFGDGLYFSTDGMSSAGKRDFSNSINSTQAQINAQLAFIQWQTWYNSEVQKIQRMRAAGLNPDLLGLDSASESSGSLSVDGVDVAGLSQAETARMQQAAMQRAAEVQSAISIAGTVLSAVTSVFSIIGSVASIGVTQATKKLVEEQTNAQKLQNYGSVRNTAASLWLDNLTALVGDVGETKFGDISSEVLESSFKNASASITGDSEIDRMIRREMSAMKNNPEMLSNYYAQRQALVSNMLKSAETEAHPNFQGDYYGTLEAFRPLARSSYNVIEQDLQRQLAELKTQIDYFKTFNGSTKAGSENALNAYTKEFQEALDPEMSAWYQNITAQEAASALQYRYEMLSGYYNSMESIKKGWEGNWWQQRLSDIRWGSLSALYQTFGAGTGSLSLPFDIGVTGPGGFGISLGK